MRTYVLLALLALCGCENADVLSSDGTTRVAGCYSSNWIKCVATACPRGYDVVVDTLGTGAGIIKCKPL